ncbi:hypothetical protein [Clostridium grantii]|uniref:YfjL-like N-terminal domain-containing protein n=1 Tax=Clostridium grantii DSM 8605 TaxID=1121316 RepID=A0A1M5XW99_9CLOT|nr:hypothetical protein [Clostridium grantii]SHI04107.1 hypothetical protein SAMN02745207_03989 [Clostridium grantii DSM 8605]
MSKNRFFLILKVIIIVLLCFIGLFVFSLFKGPPFGGILAKNKILNYASAMYGDVQLVTKVDYNIKDQYYFAELSGGNNQNIKEIRYSLFENKLGDEVLMEKISTEFNSDFFVAKEFLQENIQITDGYIYTVIDANNKYTNKIEDLSLEQKLYILGIKNSDISIIEKESIKKPAEITRKIIDQLGDKYNITAVQIIYMDVNGVFQIVADNSNLSYSDLEKKTSKIQEIGEEDKLFIESLKLK